MKHFPADVCAEILTFRVSGILQRIFEAIGGFLNALVPAPTPAGAQPRPGGRLPNTNNGTRHNLMMDGSPRTGGGGGGFFNDLQQFQQPNPHGDFAQQPSTRRSPVPPVVVPPPSEEDIATLMVNR
jgi:hypothetical protein